MEGLHLLRRRTVGAHLDLIPVPRYQEWNIVRPACHHCGWPVLVVIYGIADLGWGCAKCRKVRNLG